ncbi:MAG TPA: cytochrome c3 family protein [Pirellulales bacterium]|jgi:hypothetical protein|nr:cytochrome c3 family protein [Pirellulales bacterium]
MSRLPPFNRFSALLPSIALAVLALAIAWPQTVPSRAAPPEKKKQLDPAAWGSDHVGQPLPQYTEGGECLFCHRNQVGGSWQTDKHNRTIRDAEPTEPAIQALAAELKTKSLSPEVKLLMGDTRAQRFLKRSPAYGKADLLSVVATFGRGRRARLEGTNNPHWDTEAFATGCAGCHATAVDPQTHAFSTVALDCYACHGESPAEHTEDTRLISLAKARKDSPAVVASICGSCHIRFGKSKASGLPYPTNFVAGDNLFKDFEVDWNVTDDPKLNPADGHVMDNLRDIVLFNRESTTCLSCHDVHTGSSKKHRELPVVDNCQRCHDAGTPIKGHKAYEVHSERCQY